MKTIHAMFLFAGFVAKDPDFSDIGTCQIDAAFELAPWAEAIGDCWEYLHYQQDFPGTFDYEVTKPFGEWLRDNWGNTYTEQRGKLADLMSEFFRENKGDRQGLDRKTMAHLRTLIKAHIA